MAHISLKLNPRYWVAKVQQTEGRESAEYSVTNHFHIRKRPYRSLVRLQFEVAERSEVLTSFYFTSSWSAERTKRVLAKSNSLFPEGLLEKGWKREKKFPALLNPHKITAFYHPLLLMFSTRHITHLKTYNNENKHEKRVYRNFFFIHIKNFFTSEKKTLKTILHVKNFLEKF